MKTNDHFEKISIRINMDQNGSSKEWWRLCKGISFGKSYKDSIPSLLYDGKLLATITQKQMFVMNILHLFPTLQMLMGK